MNKNKKCTSCGKTDLDCYKEKTSLKFNGACCWTCHRTATHGQNDMGHTPIYEAIKDWKNNMPPITTKSSKTEVIAAYRAAQDKLDNMLPLIRQSQIENGLDFCESGLEDFCDEAGIEYVPNLNTVGFALSLTFSLDEVQPDPSGGATETEIKRVLETVENALLAVGITANVNIEDSYVE